MPLKAIRYEDEKDDGRKKLTSQQKEEIKRLFADSKNEKELAIQFGVAISTIKYIVDPKYRAQKSEKAKLTWRKYYDKKKHAENMRKYRAKKRKLGLLRY